MPSQPGFTFSRKRHYLPYFLMILIFVGGIWLILKAGAGLQTGTVPTLQPSLPASSTGVLWENFRTPLSILLVQIIVILIMAGLFRRLFRRIHQPPVMGEMIAGIVLGPSVLGLIYPQALGFLFPASSLGTLRQLSQIGVVLFMFIVGTELNIRYVREKGSAAVMISHASIIVPFLLGAALSLFLYRELAAPGTSFNAFALFIGVAMSITAFPVLARILEDRRLSQTTLGSIALTCAAVDDVTAWCILALVIALVKSAGLASSAMTILLTHELVKSAGLASSAMTILLTLVFALAMFFLVRPQLARVIKEPVSQSHRRGLIPI